MPTEEFQQVSFLGRDEHTIIFIVVIIMFVAKVIITNSTFVLLLLWGYAYLNRLVFFCFCVV